MARNWKKTIFTDSLCSGAASSLNRGQKSDRGCWSLKRGNVLFFVFENRGSTGSPDRRLTNACSRPVPAVPGSQRGKISWRARAAEARVVSSRHATSPADSSPGLCSWMLDRVGDAITSSAERSCHTKRR